MTREKLIELLMQIDACICTLCGEAGALERVTSVIADHLIANGVTIPVRCKECGHGSHVDTPEGRVWCDKMCRYMVVEGYCSYGERRKNG